MTKMAKGKIKVVMAVTATRSREKDWDSPKEARRGGKM